MKGVIYARYSSEKQQETSIEGQIRDCMAYAEHHDITIVDTYIDRAYTGTDDNRPDFQRMIADSSKGIFDTVIVWKYDRFARGILVCALNMDKLTKNDVKLVSAKETVAEGPEGILAMSIFMGMAEYFSLELAVKVKRGMRENALQAKYNGGTVTFGYYIDENKYFQVDSQTSAIVLDVFTKYDEGFSMKEIKDYLNDTGVRAVRNKTTSSKPVGIDFISNLLHNRRYIGEYKFDDTVVSNQIPAIVPQELFDRVQEKLAKICTR